MYRSILVPLDGSAFGEQALPLALGIARRAGAQLHLAHVHVPILSPGADNVMRLDETIDAAKHARESVYLAALVRRIQTNYQLTATAAMLDGPIVDALHCYATASKIDLIAMTTHGYGAAARFWLGSNADRLMRRAPVPILLARSQELMLDPAHEPVLKHILITLDGSTLAETILPHAIALGTLSQVAYTLLLVVDDRPGNDAAERYTADGGEQALARNRARGQAYLDRVAAGMRAEALRVQTDVLVGSAAPAILKYAREHAIDLIALATHGRSGMARLLLGSVADKIVRGAELPVLLFRPRVPSSSAYSIRQKD
jgi:nucleotide-binding universal stress UspA family protein